MHMAFGLQDPRKGSGSNLNLTKALPLSTSRPSRAYGFESQECGLGFQILKEMFKSTRRLKKALVTRKRLESGAQTLGISLFWSFRE